MSFSTMEEETIKVLRQTTRNNILLKRRKQRDEEIDLRRSLENLQTNSADVEVLTNKLKTNISAADLKLLQNALVDDPKNAEILLNIHGAFRGLIRDLTGNDVNKQIASSGCLCNLALGNVRTCWLIGKFAGVYLMATLDSLTEQLAVTCAWTLGNIACSGPQVCNLIIEQGAVAKLCVVMHRSRDMEEASVYALTHIAHQLKDSLGSNQVGEIMEHLCQIDFTPEASRLLFILSCHKNFKISIQYLKKVVLTFGRNIEKHINVCSNATTVRDSDTSCCNVIYLTRVLANIDDLEAYKMMLTYFVNAKLVDNLSRLLDLDSDNSVCWLLGNMLNICGDDAFSTKDWLAMQLKLFYNPVLQAPGNHESNNPHRTEN